MSDNAMYDYLPVVVELGDPYNESFEVDASLVTDPDESMARTLDAVDKGAIGAMYDFVRLLGIDTTGWRMSKLSRFMEAFQPAVKKASQLTLGESNGSGKSSGPTAKKSNTRSSNKG